MTLPRVEDLIALVGEEEFVQAAAEARRWAPTTGYGGEGFHSELPHDLWENVWYHAAEPPEAKLPLLFALYERLPCYALVMHLAVEYPDFAATAQTQLWVQFRTYLDSEDAALAGPIAYTLWCDWFESSDQVEEAWTEVWRAPLSSRRCARLLQVAGPVPWRLKAPRYAELVRDVRWNEALLESLHRSVTDVRGQVDPAQAMRLLARLQLPPSEKLEQTRVYLQAKLNAS